jgi:hypothetical protein
MVTYNTQRKKDFRCLFALVTVITLAVSHVALGAGPAFRNSGTFSSGSHRQPSFSRPFHRFGFFDRDGLDAQQVVIVQQPQSAPTTESSEPTENRIYVPPRWVDGGYGVQVLKPGYWAVPKQTEEH